MGAADSSSPWRPAAGDGAERRSRLRQYQVQLLERVQAAKSGAQAVRKDLGVLIGERHCLLDLTHVGEIVEAPAISAVPLAQHWYLGLANIRGQLTGVIDLARYRGDSGEGGAAEANAPARRVITFAPALGFNCALRIDDVLGLRDVAGMTPQPGGGSADDWAAHGFCDADQRRWTRIDLALLVREARFLHVGF